MQDVSLFIKREDLNHPFVSGNKWWKLKYNLEVALAQGKDTLLTFGGAYSNHIYATAAAAQEMRLKAVGIIRGEEKTSENQVMQFARGRRNASSFCLAELYRLKSEEDFVQKLQRTSAAFILSRKEVVMNSP